MSVQITELLTFEEVAIKLKKSESQLRWMVYSGSITKPAKIGGRLMWKADQLEAFIQAQFADSEGSGSAVAS